MKGLPEMIPVNEPLLDGNEKRYLAECVQTGWISSEGPFVRVTFKLDDQPPTTMRATASITVGHISPATLALRAIGGAHP